MASHALKPHFMSIPQDHLGLLVSLPESVSLLAVNWHTGGQHQIRKPRGPWLCALLPYMDMPVGWPRNDGLMGLQHCSAQLPRVTTQAGTLDPVCNGFHSAQVINRDGKFAIKRSPVSLTLVSVPSCLWLGCSRWGQGVVDWCPARWQTLMHRSLQAN